MIQTYSEQMFYTCFWCFIWFRCFSKTWHETFVPLRIHKYIQQNIFKKREKTVQSNIFFTFLSYKYLTCIRCCILTYCVRYFLHAVSMLMSIIFRFWAYLSLVHQVWQSILKKDDEFLKLVINQIFLYAFISHI